MWYCTDDFGRNPDYACSADNNHYKEGGRPDMDYCGDDDDPAILDGIVGINDPEDNEPMPMSENMIGVVSDNEGLPLMMGSSFKVHFDGVDESLETHDLYIPIGGDSDYDEKWHVDINLLSGYEVISCEGCEDLVIEGSNAKFNANEPVTVIFGSRPDCDHTVTIGDDGYSFEPAELLINVGDTVCWIWDTEEEHNVVEIATKFDADMNLEDARIGFYSGDPSNIVDFRHTFTEDDKTHYYVCEPHISMSMAGAIIVGLGSEDDRIPEVIEDSGLPNISFIAGALVLVGAAGLRRRIH
jgi:plastocyanin